MIEIALVSVLGALVGLAVGIVPGMGTSFALIAGYPVIAGWPTDWMLCYYVAVTMSSQFSGSVSALMFGVLGEITSQPALKSRFALQQAGQINSAIVHTAHASMLAVATSALVVVVLWTWLPAFVYVLRTEVKLVLLTMIMIMTVYLSANHKALNAVLAVIGGLLGLVGYNHQGTGVFTFGQWWLAGGVPVMVLLAGLVAVPGAIQFLTVKLNASAGDTNSIPMSWSAAVRGSVLGSVVGLLPVIGNAITSNVAWAAERKQSSVLHRLTAAEAANNSGNVTVLLPLLMFGLPIVPSEMILYNMLSAQGWTNQLLSAQSLLYIFSAAAISSILAWLLCGTWSQQLVATVQQWYRELAVAAVAITAVSVLYLGIQAYNAVFYLTVLAISVVIGTVFRRCDFTPLIVAFLISAPLTSSAVIFSQLYF
jgi:putative tricarboxylic transport membrane protein